MRAFISGILLVVPEQVVVGEPFTVTFAGLTVSNPFDTFFFSLSVDGPFVEPLQVTWHFLEPPPSWRVSLPTLGPHELTLWVTDSDETVTDTKIVMAVERGSSVVLPVIIIGAVIAGLILGAAAGKGGEGR